MVSNGNDPAPDEAARLAALHAFDVLDTPSSQGFDDLASVAACVCQAPVALVTLLDRDRQVFKAHVGTEIAGTPIDLAICTHALAKRALLVIPDLSLDPRTRDNPLVTGNEHVRFYAGAPLLTADGHMLGTLCVLDRTPRPDGLTPAQATTLQALARQVMSQLELKRALDERRVAAERREADRAVAFAEAQRLEAMIATQQAVATAKADLGTVFQAIVDGALRVVDAADGAVVELRSGDDLVYDTVSGSSAPHKGIRLPFGATLSGRAVALERPLHCADTRLDAEVDHALARSLGIRSMIVVPVTRRGEPIGALKLQSGKPGSFSPRDIAMTQMLAGLVASAVGDVAEVRSRKALRDAENRYRRTFESVTEFGVVVTDRAGTVTEWNTGAERIFGWAAEDMVGRPAETFYTPEDRAGDRTGIEMRLSLDEGQAVDERWHLRRDGSRFYASGNMMPLRDDDGQHLGFIKIVRDRTEQHLAGVRLEESERQLRQAQEAGGIGLFTIDVPTGLITATPEFSRLYGYEHRETRPAADYEALVVEADRALVSSDATRRAGDAPKDVEYRIRRADTGAERWIARKGEFHLGEAGRPVRFAGIASDVTARRRADDALLQSQNELEVERGLLRAVIRQAPLGISIAYADGRGELNTRLQEMLGHGVGDGGDHRYATYGALHADGRPFEPEHYPTLRALRGGETLIDEPMVYRNAETGELRRWEVSTTPVRDASGEILAAVSVVIDVEDRRRAEEQRAVLNAELAHRLKNTLALVSSIVTQTLRTAPDIAAARRTLSDRVQALSRAHDVLLTGQRDAASVAEIVEAAASLLDAGSRVIAAGPELKLGPKASLTLSLILHELATNAGKYGALSVEGGVVDVEWRVAVDPETRQPHLTFEWREIGGPPVTPPTRRSFGTRLIEMGLSGSSEGSSVIDYLPDGVRCRITASLTELQAEDA